MTALLKVIRIGRGRPPVFSAEWRGRPLAIRLDTSAVLKLEGNSDYNELDAVLLMTTERVSVAAKRILEMRRFDGLESELTIVITALDLD